MLYLSGVYLQIYCSHDIICVYCSPPIESRNMRYAMLNQQSDLIGDTKAFDGATLFLPTVSVSLTFTRNTNTVHVALYIFLSCKITLH